MRSLLEISRTKMKIQQTRNADRPIGKHIIWPGENKGRWKQYTENLYRWDKRITNIFEKIFLWGRIYYSKEQSESYPESMGRNKSLGLDEIPIELFQVTET